MNHWLNISIIYILNILLVSFFSFFSKEFQNFEIYLSIFAIHLGYILIFLIPNKQINAFEPIFLLYAFILWILYITSFYVFSGSYFEFYGSDSQAYWSYILLSIDYDSGPLWALSYFAGIDDIGALLLHYLAISIYPHPLTLKVLNLIIHYSTYFIIKKDMKNIGIVESEKLSALYLLSGTGIYYAASSLKETAFLFFVMIFFTNRNKIVKFIAFISLFSFRLITPLIIGLSIAFSRIKQGGLLIAGIIFGSFFFEPIVRLLGLPSRYFILNEVETLLSIPVLDTIIFFIVGLMGTITTLTFEIDSLPNIFYSNYTLFLNVLSPMVIIYLFEALRRGNLDSRMAFFLLTLVILALVERTLKFRYLMVIAPFYLYIIGLALSTLNERKKRNYIYLSVFVIPLVLFWNLAL